jgi:hypothetical protein
MKNAYHREWLRNLTLMKEAKTWSKSNFISSEEYSAIANAYPSKFYHPNLIIRILIFIASLLGLGGITGLFAIFFNDLNEDSLAVMAIVYGLASFVVLEKFVIKGYHHYKSGLTEALLYHAMGFALIGLAVMMDFEEQGILWACLLMFSFAAFRYVDLISTLVSLCLGAYLLFYYLYEFGGLLQQLIPVFFLLAFTPLYFLIKNWRARESFDAWENVLLIAEAFSLLVVYAAGNYLVVRELSVSLMSLELTEGQDIPFAFLFYGLTVLIPALYLYVGIRKKDVVLLRVSLLVIAFSVFTFKYYYSLGHPEITLTLAGALLLLISIALFHYLRTPIKGFTRESVLTEKWANTNAEALIISQTLGGNKIPDSVGNNGGGGSFGGGGASGEF